MKYNKDVAGLKKSKSIHYSTHVTAKKGEIIIIWTCAILFFIMLFFSIFVLKNLNVMVITIVAGIIVMFTLMFLCVFRPLHKEERQANAVVTKMTTNQSYNNITGKVEDNSEIEEIEK